MKKKYIMINTNKNNFRNTFLKTFKKTLKLLKRFKRLAIALLILPLIPILMLINNFNKHDEIVVTKPVINNIPEQIATNVKVPDVQNVKEDLCKKAETKQETKKEVKQEQIASRSGEISRKSDISDDNILNGYNVKKSFTANCSAYTASQDECGNSRGLTASGEKVKEWHTIAAPKSIPFGTKIYIPYFKDYPNQGVFIVTDRGGAIKGNHIDVYVKTKSEAFSFGRRNLEVFIIE